MSVILVADRSRMRGSGHRNKTVGWPVLSSGPNLPEGGKGNYTACVKGYGYCDTSRLTVEETHSLPPKGH